LKILSEAPGKLILLGEYAVLEGVPALVAAVNRFARVVLTAAPGDHFVVAAPVIDVGPQRFRLNADGRIEFLQQPLEKLKFFGSIFESAVRVLRARRVPISPVQITLDTSEFFLRKGAAKLGLGSSAALTVALLAALFEQYDPGSAANGNRAELFRTALFAHREAQGNVGSGVDVAACVFGGVLQYTLREENARQPAEVVPLTFPEDVLVLPVWSGKPSSTSALVNQFFAYKKENGNGYRKLLERLTGLTTSGVAAFREGNVSGFFSAVENYYRAMLDVGRVLETPIISPEHQSIAAAVRRRGGVYKPSGAGGGDLGIAFVQSARQLTQTASEVQKAGFDVVHLELGAPGVRVRRMQEA